MAKKAFLYYFCLNSFVKMNFGISKSDVALRVIKEVTRKKLWQKVILIEDSSRFAHSPPKNQEPIFKSQCIIDFLMIFFNREPSGRLDMQHWECNQRSTPWSTGKGQKAQGTPLVDRDYCVGPDGLRLLRGSILYSPVRNAIRKVKIQPMAQDFPDGLLREFVLRAANQNDLSWSFLRSTDQETWTAGPEGAAENGNHRTQFGERKVHRWGLQNLFFAKCFAFKIRKFYVIFLAKNLSVAS